MGIIGYKMIYLVEVLPFDSIVQNSEYDIDVVRKVVDPIENKDSSNLSVENSYEN